MDRELLDTFTPADDLPLVVEFVSHARKSGYSAAIRFDAWDFELYAPSSVTDEPVAVVKSLKSGVGRRVLEAVLSSEAPVKLLLIEDRRLDPAKAFTSLGFLAMSGVGAYLRGHGWLTLPGRVSYSKPEDFALRRARRWRQSEDGTWLKACTACGELHGVEGFYRTRQAGRLDPYRDVCKACWKDANARRYRARKRLGARVAG